MERFRKLEIDALIAIGGDGSLSIAHALHQKGLPVIGVPKTIDNDLSATDVTFGFQTAVEVATDAIGRLHSTAEAHQRVMVVQLMGRHTGWIALESGPGRRRGRDPDPRDPLPRGPHRRKGARARPAAPPLQHRRRGRGRALGGGRGELRGRQRGATAASRTGWRSRSPRPRARRRASLVLGHIQRGGEPIAYDRSLALRFGAAAVRCIREGSLGTMVALQGNRIRAVPLGDAVHDIKRVPAGLGAGDDGPPAGGRASVTEPGAFCTTPCVLPPSVPERRRDGRVRE